MIVHQQRQIFLGVRFSNTYFPRNALNKTPRGLGFRGLGYICIYMYILYIYVYIPHIENPLYIYIYFPLISDFEKDDEKMENNRLSMTKQSGWQNTSK